MTTHHTVKNHVNWSIGNGRRACDTRKEGRKARKYIRMILRFFWIIYSLQKRNNNINNLSSKRLTHHWIYWIQYISLTAIGCSVSDFSWLFPWQNLHGLAKAWLITQWSLMLQYFSLHDFPDLSRHLLKHVENIFPDRIRILKYY